MRTRSQKGMVVVDIKKKNVTFHHEQYVIIFDKLQSSININKKLSQIVEPLHSSPVKCFTPPVKKTMSPKKSYKKKSSPKKKEK